MLVRLELPYADVAAGDLSLRLDAPGRAGLGTLSLAAGGFVVELRLLGRLPPGGGGRRAGSARRSPARPAPAPGLPSRSRRRAVDVAYDFVARVERLDATAYEQRARALVAAAAADPRGLVGVFPGHDGAFTSLQVLERPRGAAWVTWHGYPQTGELVRMRSAIARR